jgi:hypothetical protein
MQNNFNNLNDLKQKTKEHHNKKYKKQNNKPKIEQ